MNILDDVNYEIAVLQRNIKDTYNASSQASARADFVAAALMLEAADDLQQELRAALDFRADLLGEVPCDTCEGDQCSNCYYDDANDGTTVTLQISEDLDQSYQLDVLLNEMNVMAGQIEYQQDEIDYLQDELKDAEDAIDYWVDKAQDNDDAQADYDSLLSIFKALQIDYHNLEKTLFSERASFDKANDLLHDELTDAEAGIDFYVGQSMDEEARADALYNALASIADLSSCRISNCCNVESRLNQIFTIAEGAL